MKKLLIAMLALITALSISLTACGNKKDKNEDPVDDDPDDEFVMREDEGDDTTTAPSEGDDTTTQSGSWVEKNDTVYTLLKCKIRPEATTSKASIGIAEFAASYHRVATNGTWDKIEYNDGFAYISSALLTTNAQRITFDDKSADATLLHLKASGTEETTKANLREFPTGQANSLGVISETETANAENALTLLAISQDGSWAKVSYTGKIGEKTFTNQVCYITTEYIAELNTNTDSGNIPG